LAGAETPMLISTKPRPFFRLSRTLISLQLSAATREPVATGHVKTYLRG
jgi:hypothetical protein